MRAKFEPQVRLLICINTVQLIIINSLPHHMSISFGKSQYVAEMVEIRITFRSRLPLVFNHRQDEFAQIALSKETIQFSILQFLLSQK